MPYFKMSTANPTGHRPWNFALQGMGRLRGRGLNFYTPANYPLPARTLGAMLPRMQKLTTSPYSGKADYGDPAPVYSPLHPSYYSGLGMTIYNGSPAPAFRRGVFIGPPVQNPSLTWQQQQIINAQQQAANNAAATAAAVAAAQASQTAAATLAPVAAPPSWFTDPSQELITGLPNWGLLAIAGGALFLFKKR
jgi:hypothetical protein